MDEIDRKLLGLLRNDATTPMAQLAERVGLSATPIWKRIQKMEQAGVIARRVALLEPEHVGIGLIVFVAIAAHEHSPHGLATFAAAIGTMPEVMDAYRMAGEVDYMLRVAVTDKVKFDALEHAASQRDLIRLAAGEDLFGLLRSGDQADGNGIDPGRLLHRLRERNLVSGSQGDFLQRRDAALEQRDQLLGQLGYLSPSRFASTLHMTVIEEPTGEAAGAVQYPREFQRGRRHRHTSASEAWVEIEPSAQYLGARPAEAPTRPPYPVANRPWPPNPAR